MLSRASSLCTEPTLTIRPRLRAIMRRATGCATRKTLSRLVRINSRQVSSGKSSSAPRRCTPALLTRMSMGPNARSMSSTARAISPLSVTSNTASWTSAPVARSSAAASATFAGVRPLIATLAPAPARPRASGEADAGGRSRHQRDGALQSEQFFDDPRHPAPSCARFAAASRPAPRGPWKYSRIHGSSDCSSSAIGPMAMTLPLAEHGDAVADRVEAVEIVGDHEHGQPQGRLQGRDELVELAGADRVEAGGRLVEEQTPGSSASARASAARLIMPPESSEGSFSAASGGRPTSRSSASPVRAQRRRDVEVLAHRRLDVLPHGEAREQRALLEQHAPARSTRARSGGVSASRSRPSTSIVPARFGCRPRIVRVSTDLPAPEAPTKPSTSPRRTSRSSPSITLRGRRSRPPGRARGSPASSLKTAPPRRTSRTRRRAR